MAAGNPHAWNREALTAEQIWQPTPKNRMISWPYTKLMNSNDMVDQGAVLILASAEKAEYLQIPSERWVSPYAGADSHDTYAIGERAEFHTSPAIRIAGKRALELAGASVDDMNLIDVYSCFPSAVQVAANELGLPIGDPNRPLTVTGVRPSRRAVEQLRHALHRDDGRAAGVTTRHARPDHRQRRLSDQAQLRRLWDRAAQERIPCDDVQARSTGNRHAPHWWTGAAWERSRRGPRRWIATGNRKRHSSQCELLRTPGCSR